MTDNPTPTPERLAEIIESLADHSCILFKADDELRCAVCDYLQGFTELQTLRASQPRYRVGDRVWVNSPNGPEEVVIDATVLFKVNSLTVEGLTWSVFPFDIYPDRASAEAAVSTNNKGDSNE